MFLKYKTKVEFGNVENVKLFVEVLPAGLQPAGLMQCCTGRVHTLLSFQVFAYASIHQNANK